jgi:hypothetical protein
MKATIKQIIDLQVEIAGIKSDKFTVVGLLNEKLNIKTKYWLQKLFKKVKTEADEYSEAEKALFISLGAEEVGKMLLVKDTLKDGSPNPSRAKLDEEREKLLNEIIDLGEFEFKIEDFDFESESNYYTFMSVAFGI